MDSGSEPRAIVSRIEVPASLDDVWNVWTTEEGAQSFFAPKCRIDLRPGGRYEMLFDLDAEPGKQGGEGVVVLAVQPKQMLSFTWNAPPSLPTVRNQRTHVVVRMFETGPNVTQVTLTHDGWGYGGEWDEAFQYFSRAWSEAVLPRLRERFLTGPRNWESS